MSNIIDCESVRLSEGTIRGLLGCQLHRFGAGSRVYDPLKEEYADVSKAEVQIKPDPNDGNQFRLHINGKNIFQWFKDLWQSLSQTIMILSAIYCLGVVSSERRTILLR